MRSATFFQALVAFLIVAFGQPSFLPCLAPVAAAVGYALFWKAISIYPFKIQRFWRAVFWYGSISMVQLSWMTSIQFQGFYILFVWIVLSFAVGLQFGLLSACIPPSLRSLTIPRILALAGLWTLIEWSRFHWICGYSWNLSGLALSNFVAMQFASVFGVLGLSFWVILSNLIGVRAMSKGGVQSYCVWMVILGIPYLFGWAHLSYHKKQLAHCHDL